MHPAGFLQRESVPQTLPNPTKRLTRRIASSDHHKQMKKKQWEALLSVILGTVLIFTGWLSLSQ